MFWNVDTSQKTIKKLNVMPLVSIEHISITRDLMKIVRYILS